MHDRAVFLRPIAHRGLHDPAKGIIENTAPAFQAAVAKGYGVECDVRPAVGGLPVVFHDETLERLIDGEGPVAACNAADLKRMKYHGQDTSILTLAELLDIVGQRVPVFVEVKSEWAPPNREFLAAIAALAKSYSGPLALMSFDPAVMTLIKNLAPHIPRGIVSGPYDRDGWWCDKLTPERAERLRHFLESAPAAPDFYAYDVKALPTPVTRFMREVMGLPLFAWTVRSGDDRQRAAAWADAPIFEGYDPSAVPI